MFQWISKKPRLEIIGIHIHKTAGQSFREILRQVYGKDFFRININKKFFENNTLDELENIIPSHTRVLQGHFKFSDVEDIYRKSGAKVLTWLRRPEERVLSQFYYKSMKKEAGRLNSREFDDSLDEFIVKDICRNNMSKALKGIALKDMIFVGIQEHFLEDLQYLAQLLDWKDYTPVVVNSNKSFRARFPLPDEETMAQIRSLNEEDVALYEEALQIRNQRVLINK